MPKTRSVDENRFGVRMKYLLTKLKSKDKQRKMFVQRLSEPLHINFLALFAAAFGSFRRKADSAWWFDNNMLIQC